MELGGGVLVAKWDGGTIQWVPQLQAPVTAAQTLTPVPLLLPAGPAAQLHPAWDGSGQVHRVPGLIPHPPEMATVWVSGAPTPLLTDEVISRAQVIVPHGHQQHFLGQLLSGTCVEKLLWGEETGASVHPD